MNMRRLEYLIAGRSITAADASRWYRIIMAAETLDERSLLDPRRVLFLILMTLSQSGQRFSLVDVWVRAKGRARMSLQWRTVHLLQLLTFGPQIASCYHL